MTPSDLKKYYQSGYKFCLKTGMSQSSYSNWFKWGYIPLESQAKIQSLTNGELKAQWSKHD